MFPKRKLHYSIAMVRIAQYAYAPHNRKIFMRYTNNWVLPDKFCIPEQFGIVFFNNALDKFHLMRKIYCLFRFICIATMLTIYLCSRITQTHFPIVPNGLAAVVIELHFYWITLLYSRGACTEHIIYSTNTYWRIIAEDVGIVVRFILKPTMIDKWK